MYACRHLVAVAVAGILISATGACDGGDEGEAEPATATAAATAAGAGSSSPAASFASAPATGAWSYTDGSREVVTLDEMPGRLVMHASSAAALIPLGIRPVGIYADGPIADDLALRNLDLEGIEIVGEEWGVINVEAVAALKPDLIVAEWWPVEQAHSGLEEGTSSTSKQIAEVAPIAGPAQGQSIVTMIENYETLAASLGADLDAPEIAANRLRFETAVANFQAAIEAKPGLDVLAVSPSTDALYVAVPEFAAELADFMSWGLDIVVPDEPDPGFEYWQTLSWENADMYEADLVIVDERSWPANVEEANASQPTWHTLEAVAAGNVAVWPAYWVRNHSDYANSLERLTEAISNADPNLVP
jgi:iron complex transport system substrate-binding protein